MLLMQEKRATADVLITIAFLLIVNSAEPSKVGFHDVLEVARVENREKGPPTCLLMKFSEKSDESSRTSKKNKEDVGMRSCRLRQKR